MTPATYDIPPHYKGDTFEAITFTIKENGIGIDLTGSDIRVDFKKNGNTGSLQESISVGAGITINNAIGGVFTLDSFVNNWSVGKYFYDAEITFADGTVNTYFKGSLSINQDITNG
jgi:hypothetical protein